MEIRSRRVRHAIAIGLGVLALLIAGGAEADIWQTGNLRVSFNGSISPSALPRHRPVPVAVTVQAAVTTSDRTRPRPMRHLKIEINRNGNLYTRGLPTCPQQRIKSTSTQVAKAVCKRALVGEGHFTGRVALPDQPPLPAQGKLLAFNAKLNGQPEILMHVYSARPAPTTIILPVTLRREGRGAFGTALTLKLPTIGSDNGYVTGFEVTFRRTYRFKGKRRSYLSASCPAQPGFPGASFPFVRGTFKFSGHRTVVATIDRHCNVRGS